MNKMLVLAALWVAYTIGHIRGWDHRGAAS